MGESKDMKENKDDTQDEPEASNKVTVGHLSLNPSPERDEMDLLDDNVGRNISGFLEAASKNHHNPTNKSTTDPKDEEPNPMMNPHPTDFSNKNNMLMTEADLRDKKILEHNVQPELKEGEEETATKGVKDEDKK